MNKYTVILLYPDLLLSKTSALHYLAHVEAQNVDDAVIEAKRECVVNNDFDVEDTEELATLSVFSGYQVEL